MITSNSNKKIKQVALWQSKAKERKKDNVFVVEGAKMFLEAPEEAIREVYVSQSFSERISGSLNSHAEEILRKLTPPGFES